MHKEFGSEFWTSEITTESWIPSKWSNMLFPMCGRTALDLIIQNIKKENSRQLTAYLPSYCCETMIIPFVSNGIKVCFYEVVQDEKKGLKFIFDKNIKVDILYFVQSYFGFFISNSSEVYDFFCSKIIIEDKTHYAFDTEHDLDDVDYSYASMRKWTGLPVGAILYSKKAIDLESCHHADEHKFYFYRKKAMSLKEIYILNESELVDKNEYLSMFKKAEMSLEQNYKNYLCPPAEEKKIRYLDKEKILTIRKENASLVQNIFKKYSLFKYITDSCYPLFVPLCLQTKQRDFLQKKLAQEGVYCPIHWPMSNLHTISENAKKNYNQELSLICDHRYSAKELEFIYKRVL